MRATPEQDAAVAAFGTGQHLVLQAGAGTGKTTALTMIGASTSRRGIYVAFNKAIALDAGRRFGRNVVCKTEHALAMRAVGHKYKARLDGARIPSWRVGKAFGVPGRVVIGSRPVTATALSYTAVQTVRRFCHTADPVIAAQHVPRLRGLEGERYHAQLVEVVLPYAHKIWADVQSPDGGVARFEHDHYLKMWALTRPRINGDFLLLDEAQDTNPVLEEVFTAQRDHAQLVMVGDSAQAMYGWRGARDVMTGFDGLHLNLSQSFRFGSVVAQEANRWLEIAQAPIRLQGCAGIHSSIGPVERPDAILCRTNAGTMLEVIQLLATGQRVALVGGGDDLQKLANAARDLKAGRRTSHPELMLFQSWRELQEYAEDDPSGHDLRPLVDAVDQHGVEAILNAVFRLCDESMADVTVSTAHRAKGREWSTVRIGDDFVEPADYNHCDPAGRPQPGTISPEEARVAYVAVTRAQHRLDLGGLSWINTHPQGGRTPSPHGRETATASPSGPTGQTVRGIPLETYLDPSRCDMPSDSTAATVRPISTTSSATWTSPDTQEGPAPAGDAMSTVQNHVANSPPGRLRRILDELRPGRRRG